MIVDIISVNLSYTGSVLDNCLFSEECLAHTVFVLPSSAKGTVKSAGFIQLI
jgi:hypothetical protein